MRYKVNGFQSETINRYIILIVFKKKNSLKNVNRTVVRHCGNRKCYSFSCCQKPMKFYKTLKIFFISPKYYSLFRGKQQSYAQSIY